MSTIANDLRKSIRGDVSDDGASRGAYATDASNYRHVPDCVVFPKNADDVAATVDACRSTGTPLVSRGGGTSIGGQAIGEGVVVDFSRYMNEIIELDPKSRTARVQPGVVLDTLNARARQFGLVFGPDPSTHSRCTIGGMIGNNSCGSRSLAWGTTADNLVDLDVLLSNGKRLEISDLADSGDLLGTLELFMDRHRGAIESMSPRFSRRISGYGLDALINGTESNLARALAGSEGTLAVVVESTIRLVELPAARVLVVLGFPDQFVAADYAPQLVAHHPLTIESVGPEIIASYRAAFGSSPVMGKLPDGGAWLYCEIGGSSTDEALASAFEFMRTVDVPALLVENSIDQRSFWRMREDGAGLVTRLVDGTEAFPGWEDAAVPVAELGRYLRAFSDLLAKHDLHCGYYGHFGEGCVHARIDYDFLSEAGVRSYRAFVQDAADLVAAHGGSLSGEHGDGQARSELLTRMYTPEVCEAFSAFKTIFDPKNMLNPGTIVSPRRIDANLRWAPANVALDVDAGLSFSFPNDGGSFAAALRRCVGVGRCRGEHADGGVMCPSWRATHDERHSTRGRARVLLEMQTGESVPASWRNKEALEVLDLCLSCKGCKSDCPVSVDMATYKAEFLSHHYRHRLRPPAHYTMGWMPWALRRARWVVRFGHFFARSSRLLRRIGGIAPERSLPRVAKTTFVADFAQRKPAGGQERRVALFPDTFMNYFDPQIGTAAVRVLEACGYDVELVPGTPCCGLSFVATGQLDQARRVMKRTAELLLPFAKANIPVVVLEPSCASTLRTDFHELYPGGKDAAATVVTFAEALQNGDLSWLSGQLEGRAISQIHCHQRSVLGCDVDQQVLGRSGLDAQLLDGCCGLAGSFGFENGHYEISQKIGEDTLYPALRDAPHDVTVIADGFSCRTQINQGSDRHPLHLAEVLASALDGVRPGVSS